MGRARTQGFWVVVWLVGALLAACTPAPSAPASAGAPGKPGAPQLESEVVFAAPGGSFQTGLEQCAFPNFEKTFNVKLTYIGAQPVDNLARVNAQKNSPTIDVIWTSEAEHDRGIRQGLLDVVDPATIPNLASVPASMHRAGNIGVPAGTTMAGLEYNTRVFKEKGWSPPTSWNDLWDPKYKGHVATYTVGIPFSQALLVLTSRLNGGSEANPDPGFRKMVELKPNLLAIYSTAGQMDQAYQQGTVWISLNSSSRTLDLKKTGVPVEFVAPKEGLLVLNLGMDLVKGAPHPKAALALMNYMLSPEVQNCLPKATGYGPVSSLAKVDAEEAAYVPSSQLADRYVPIDWKVVQDQLDTWVKRWNSEVEAK